ncbi:hypothetical protein WME91_37385 [Sorangium sp. So ce269]
MGSLLLAVVLCCTPVRAAWGAERGSSPAMPGGSSPAMPEGEVFIEPGEHRVEARLLGYAPASQTVKVAKGGSAEVALAMAAAKSDARDAAPVAKSAEGGGTAGAPAGAPAAEKPPAVPVDPVAPPEERSWVPVIALGAASAVGLAVGITTTVLSRNARESADAHQEMIRQMNGRCIEPPSYVTQKCRELAHDAERAASFGTVSVVAYAASGALAIAAATYALWPRRPASVGHGLRVLPQTHAGGGGVLFVGTW